MPTSMFGQKLREEWLTWHADDVIRIRVLMQYGGIILDTDSYIVRSLDVFHRHEMTIGITEREYLGYQVLIEHK
jgi:mannosyltransferase OCH1-like enzyme